MKLFLLAEESVCELGELKEQNSFKILHIPLNAYKKNKKRYKLNCLLIKNIISNHIKKFCRVHAS